MPTALSDRNVAIIFDVLAHHGVKGQKWGVRKDKGKEGKEASNRKIKRLDKKFERVAGNDYQVIKLSRVARKKFNAEDVPRINNKPEYKGANFRRDSPLRQQYMKEQKEALLDRLEAAANDLGTNASGSRRYAIVEMPNETWDVTTIEVKHANESSERFSLKVRFNETGHVVGVDIPTGIMHEMLIGDTLAHYGVPGMRWGKRKSGGSSSSSDSGESTASDDHVKANIVKGKSKATGLSSLSNSELKVLIERQNLEQQYLRLNQTKADKGRKMVEEVLTNKTKEVVGNTAAKYATKGLEALITSALKSAAKAAVKAA